LFEYVGVRVLKILMRVKEYVFVSYVTFVNKASITSPAEFVGKLRTLEEKTKLFFFSFKYLHRGSKLYSFWRRFCGISYKITFRTTWFLLAF